MKRILSVLIAAIFCVTVLCGCANDGFKVHDKNAKRIWDKHHPDETDPLEEISVTVPELDNATVEMREERNWYSVYVNGERLEEMFGSCESFYLSDLTGDGIPELCFGVCIDGGNTEWRIEIYDFATKNRISYMGSLLTEDAYGDLYLFLRNGILCVKNTEHMKQDAVRTGVLAYDGKEISVVWDKKVNADIDRDPVPSDGETVS